MAGYDAFLSYSHQRDGYLAPFVQREVERFASPWYRPRSCRVFRDNANLVANSGLWGSIEEALATSRWFVLLASPEAARSPWVDREVAWWLAHRSPSRMVIALTEGDLRWSPNSDVLPPALRQAGLPEPRWVDLRPLRAVHKLDRQDPRSSGTIAELVAAVREVPKDQLVGAHIRYRRRTIRLLAAGVTTLAVFLVVSLVAGVIALQQRDAAQEQARIATARELAALAGSTMDSRLDFAQLVAVRAYRTNPDPQTLSALFGAVTDSPHLVRFVQVDSPVVAVAGSKDGRVVVAGTSDGHLLRWTVNGGPPAVIKVGDQRVLAVAADGDGGRIAAADSEHVFIWNGQPGSAPSSVAHKVQAEVADSAGQYQLLAISPSGHTAAVTDGAQQLTIIDTEHGNSVRQGNASGNGLALPNDTVVVADTGTGSWTVLATSTLRVLSASGDMPVTPGDLYYCCGFASDGSHFVWSKYGEATVVAQAGTPRSQADETPMGVPLDQPDRFAVSTDGTRAAVAGGGSLYVGVHPGAAMQRLPGIGGVSAMAFLGGNQRLVSASGNSLVLWDLAQTSPLEIGASLTAPSSPAAGAPPMITVSPDGKRLATDGVVDNDVTVADLSSPGAPIKSVQQPISYPYPLWSADSRHLYLLGDDGAGHGGVEWSDAGMSSLWTERSTRGSATDTPQVLTARLTPDGNQAVVVDEHGDVQVRDLPSGRIDRQYQGQPDELDPPWSERLNTAAISMDAATVAEVLPTGAVRLVDTASGRSRDLGVRNASSVVFSQSQLFVALRDNSVGVWDANGATASGTIAGTAGYAQAIAALPGRSMLARLTRQGTVEVVDTDRRQVIGSLPVAVPEAAGGEPPWEATTLAVTSDGGQLITATANGTVHRWQMTPEAWVLAACASAARKLTAAEWTGEIGTTPPADLSCH